MKAEEEGEEVISDRSSIEGRSETIRYLVSSTSDLQAGLIISIIKAREDEVGGV